MSKLFFGSFVDVMQESLDLDNRKELIGYLLCLPMENGEYKYFFNNKKDKKPVMCFGRECGTIDDVKATRICKAGPSNERIDKDFRQLFLEPLRVSLMMDAMGEFLSRFTYPQIDVLLENILDLIENDGSIPRKSKDEIKKDYKNAADADMLLVNTLIYATQKSAKPPTNHEVFRSHFPPVVTKFIGRQEILGKIHSNFDDNHIQVLHGSGGIGKTQLAVAYVMDHIKKYDSIWWVDATSEQSILESYRLFLRINYIDTDTDDADAIRAGFINFMDDCSKWLLIYDNCDYYTDEQYNAFIRYLPHSYGKGRDILITSRTNQSFGRAITLEIEAFSEEEAENYLITFTSDNDRDGVLRLARRLGCFPLALEYAAAYIKENDDCNFDAYFDLIKEEGIEVLDEKAGVHLYTDTLRQAFELTRTKMISEAASINPIFKYDIIRILNVLSYLNPNGIDLRIFQDTDWTTLKLFPPRPEYNPSYYDGKSDKEVGYHAIREYHYFDFFDIKARRRLSTFLKKYSLVKIDRAGRLYMHPLTQELIRESITKENLQDSQNGSISDDALELCVNYLLRLLKDNAGKDDLFYAIGQLEGITYNHDDIWDSEINPKDVGFTERQDALAALSLLRAYVSADNSKESSDSVIQKALDLYENHDPHYTRTLFPYYMYVITTNLIIDKYIDTYPEEISHIFYALIDLEIYMSVNHGTDSELFVYSCQSAAFSIWSSFLRHYCTDAQVALGKEEQKRLCQIVTILLCSLCGYYNESYANKLPFLKRIYSKEEHMLSWVKRWNKTGERDYLHRVQIDAMTEWLDDASQTIEEIINRDMWPELPWKSIEDFNKLFQYLELPYGQRGDIPI